MGSNYNLLVIDMARAVHYHLSYLNAVSRTESVAESCFRQPAIEYIERHPQLGYSVFLEHRHPIYKYRRIDLSWAKGNTDTPSSFMEMKYVKVETAGEPEQQRYYNDLLRLASVLANNKESKCYFLASGQILNWEQCFINAYTPDESNKKIAETGTEKREPNKLMVKSVYNNWFSFDNNNPVKEVVISNDITRYKEFQKDYKKRTDVPKKNLKRFTTHLLWLSGNDPTNLSDNTMTAIWEIVV